MSDEATTGGHVLGDAWLRALGDVVATASLVEEVSRSILGKLVSGEHDLGRARYLIQGESSSSLLAKIARIADEDMQDAEYASKLAAWVTRAGSAMDSRNRIAHGAWIFLSVLPDNTQGVGSLHSRRDGTKFRFAQLGDWTQAAENLRLVHRDGVAIANEMLDTNDGAS
jgi:hypothetical protein